MTVVRDLRERRGCTQAQLAELAHTSQPTIAAYETGHRSPTLRTLSGLARAVGLEAVVEFVPPLTREDRRSLALHRAIARRLAEAEGPTLDRARRSLDTMSRRHPHAKPLLRRWRRILDGPIEEIRDVLLDPRPAARELRHVTPFAGVLTARERAAVYRRFAAEEKRRR